ncbi:MAG: hypothetical protein ACSLEL_00350 [Candidatus Malihini olakiniferum]
MQTRHVYARVVTEKEPGGIVSVWYLLNNVSGRISSLLSLGGLDPQLASSVYMPAFGAILITLFAFVMMCDAQS